MTYKNASLINAAIAVSLSLGGSVTPRIALAEGFELEEVFVTARRKEESLQDVPVAVTSFGSETMAAYNINRTEDLSAFTPGLHTERYAVSNATSLKITMRG